jgi:putative hydrolase of the HAD superfamily
VPRNALDLIGVDGDDTLWHNEIYFRLTESRFAELLAPWADPATLTERLLATERSNLDHYGYGAKAFALSMIETALDVTEHKVSGSVVAELLALGKQILAQPVELLDGVHDTLPRLAEIAPLVLITKGDLIHQDAKVAGSGLGDYFSGIEIVSEKDVASYAQVLARYGADPRRFVMVGNAVRSDVLPVLDLGGAAVYVPIEHGWAHEHAELPDGARWREAEGFRHVPRCVHDLVEI